MMRIATLSALYLLALAVFTTAYVFAPMLG